MPSLPLSLENVSLSIGGASLIEDVSLTLHHGPRTIILGANGAGKSLILRLSHGLLGPTQGSVRWGGAERLGPWRRRQAMVFQKPSMLRRSTRACAARGSPRRVDDPPLSAALSQRPAQAPSLLHP